MDEIVNRIPASLQSLRLRNVELPLEVLTGYQAARLVNLSKLSLVECTSTRKPNFDLGEVVMNFQSLEDLEISYFEAPEDSTIDAPPPFLSLHPSVRLKRLSLKMADFMDQLEFSLPPENCVALEALETDVHFLRSQFLSLADFPALKELTLYNCDGRDNCSAIFSPQNPSPRLKRISLRRACPSQELIGIIGRSCPNLEELAFEVNTLKGHGPELQMYTRLKAKENWKEIAPFPCDMDRSSFDLSFKWMCGRSCQVTGKVALRRKF